MVGSVSCKTIGGGVRDFPATPSVTAKIPIVDQLFCDKNKENCVRKSFCSERILKDGKWTLKENHPLKFCHGIIGINSDEYVEAQAFRNDVELWVRDTVSKLNRCEQNNVQ